jgi:hypothetical protein
MNLQESPIWPQKADGDGGPYDMIHTENFVLVDKSKTHSRILRRNRS